MDPVFVDVKVIYLSVEVKIRGCVSIYAGMISPAIFIGFTDQTVLTRIARRNGPGAFVHLFAGGCSSVILA